MKKRLLSIILSICVVSALTGCTEAGSTSTQTTVNEENAESSADASDSKDNGEENTTANQEAAASGENENLALAYQYGLAYAPAVIAQEKKFIEEAYKEDTGKELTIEWNQMSSGSDINTALAAGELDAGFVGLGPAINATTKGMGIKIFSNLSGQEHGFMVNDSSIKSLGDLVGTDKQIALVNLGSVQHIMLAKALVENGFGAHDLDANIVAMKHPDGLAALESGAVVGHVTSSPYLFKEQENSDFTELPEVHKAFGIEYSFILGEASEELYSSRPEVYAALCKGIEKAVDYLNNTPDEAAEILYEMDGNTVEVEAEYIKRGRYSTETNKLFEIAKFMYENDFIENEPKAYSDLVFDNVKGN